MHHTANAHTIFSSYKSTAMLRNAGNMERQNTELENV